MGGTRDDDNARSVNSEPYSGSPQEPRDYGESLPAPPPLPRSLYRELSSPAALPLPLPLPSPAAPPSLPHFLRSGRSRPAPPPVSRTLRPRSRESGETASDSLPVDLRDQLLELEEWAQANKRDGRRDNIAFWALKVPAIVASASAGLWAHFNLVAVSVVAGALASICVIVDGILPRGMLRNTHLRAYHDIRILLTKMVTDWRARNINAHDENSARRIIREAETERQRIAAYVRDAETALRYEDRS
jgi:hypothetical protein